MEGMVCHSGAVVGMVRSPSVGNASGATQEVRNVVVVLDR